MIPQDPSPQSPQPAPQSPSPVRDKRLPYFSKRGESPNENLNARFGFNENNNDSPDSIRWLLQERIVCGHLSLVYCERALKDPDFHPSALFGTVDPREESMARLNQVINELPEYCRTIHVLPSARFGAFLQQAFTNLLSRNDRPCALYMVGTTTHFLALWLRVKTNTQGAQELVAQVYDPNRTKVQSVARVANAQDWNSDGQTHDFMSFLCLGDDPTKTEEDRQDSYFSALDPDAHITLYELRADAEGNLVREQGSVTLTTNWCTNNRVLMIVALELSDTALLETAILNHFQHIEAGKLNNPDLLLEVPRKERSVLQYILSGDHGVGQAQWESFWRQTPDMEQKVRLLRGEDHIKGHLLLSVESYNKEALHWWLGLVATLPAKSILEVLEVREDLKYIAMNQWIWAKLAVTGSAWPSIVRTLRAYHPTKSRWIAQASASDDTPLITEYRNDNELSILDDWATLLTEMSADDLALILQAKDAGNVTPLHHALRQGQAAWIDWWGKHWSNAPAASKANLLCGMGQRGEPALWPLARRHQPAAFAAWRKLWRQLPDDQRAELLTANRRQEPFVSALHRAMTGHSLDVFDLDTGDAAFVRDWGACLAEVPPPQRMALLRGSPPNEWPALWQGLSSGHWAAVVAWADCLRLVTPDERVLLTALPTESDHPVTKAARQWAQKDAAGFRAALQDLAKTLPDAALDWLRALAPQQ